MEPLKKYTQDIKDVKEENPKKEKHIWNSWVKDNKDKIKDNSNYRVIGKFRYIFLIFILSLFIVGVILGGFYFISSTGNFKSIINNTNLCSCVIPPYPTIPPCPVIPSCPTINCGNSVCGNTTLIVNTNSS